MKKTKTKTEPEVELLDREDWAWQQVEDAREWLDLHPARQLVYFVESDMRMKIGVARNVRARIAELQIGNPNKIELIGVITPWMNPLLTEQLLHAVFAGYEVEDGGGEWFDLTFDAKKEVIKAFREWGKQLADDVEEILQ